MYDEAVDSIDFAKYLQIAKPGWATFGDFSLDSMVLDIPENHMSDWSGIVLRYVDTASALSEYIPLVRVKCYSQSRLLPSEYTVSSSPSYSVFPSTTVQSFPSGSGLASFQGTVFQNSFDATVPQPHTCMGVTAT